jgi:hypothetical protein
MPIKTQNYRNGDIIEVKPFSYPLISHFAILVWYQGQWQVLHATTDKGIFRQTLDEAIKNGKLIAVRPSKISGIDTFTLMNRFAKYEGMKYDLQEMNCETFVNLLANNTIISWQYIVFASILFTVSLLIVIRILR